MIDMFNSVRNLVAEADRRTALLEDGAEGAFTEEYFFLTISFPLKFRSQVVYTVIIVSFVHMKSFVTRCPV